MTARKLVIFVAFALASLGLVAVPSPAQAASVVYSYSASTGGTYIKVLDGMVQSDLTAQSYVTGGAKSSGTKNSTAAVNVAGLVDVGAVETSTDATVSTLLGATTTTVKSWARTGHVNLLGGLITADAVETNVTTTGRPNGTANATANSQLANLKIAGIKLPLNIPKNYSVTIPGVASVMLNYTLHGQSDGLTATMGWAIAVTLLKPRADMPAGVTLMVNPVNQYLSEVDPASGASMAGTAYGTKVEAKAGDGISVISDPTARVGTPMGSSNGRTIQNATLGVNVPGLLKTGVVRSTTTSTKDAFGNAEVTNTNQTAGLNLLAGLVKASAIKVTAHAKLDEGKWTSKMDMELVNLEIAGQKIPIDVSPNTEIDVAGLGKIQLNHQVKSQNGLGAYTNGIAALRITLDTSRAGLPVGAVIEVGVASTALLPPANG